MSKRDVAPLCPSARARAGHILLGVIDRGGRVVFAPRELRVDAAFIDIARQGRTPEQRFRFASPCLERGCEKWDGHRCGVARVLRQEAPARMDPPASATPPACAIRPACRWHREHGDAICFACEWVVTERQNKGEDGDG